MGHDWGATIAWHAALLRPDRFRGVIGLSVPFRPRGPVRPAVPGNFWDYAFEGTFGYLMRRAPLPFVKLEDCVGTWPGHKDHILTWDGTCLATGYEHRLRTTGWVYKDLQPSTVPLYRCYSETLKNHFASNQSDCEGLGKNEALLGYALAR